MKSIILIAPPAAGKGTQSDMLVKKYGFVHISTGDMLREVAKSDSAIRSKLENGEFISDDIVFGLLRDRLASNDCKKGFILDGFPRNVSQPIKYDEMINDLSIDSNIVIFLDIDKDVACRRIVGRVTCPNCNKVYNDMIEESMPKIKGICDVCGENLVKRSDDNIDTFDKRYNAYYENTNPLIKFYEEKGILYKVNSGMGKDSVFKVIEDIVDNLD